MLFSPLLTAAVALLAPSLVDGASYAVGKTGCYSKLPGFTKTFTEQYQAASACSTRCVPLGKPIMAIQNEDCYCGSALPPKSNKVDDSKCDKKCPGFGEDMCM